MDKSKMFERLHVDLDMVVEAHEVLRGDSGQEIPGVKMTAEEFANASVTTITILDNKGEEYMGKPKGTYITIDAPAVRNNNRDIHKEVGLLLGERLGKLLNLKPNDSVMLVGLGNWNATPDALGPRVIDSSMVTRHLHKYCPDELKGGLRAVSAIAPGVLGLTGIETAEIINGVVSRIKPDVVIAIDALAASSLDRIATSIQIADTGINPGSGVGNRRTSINFDTIGARVIAIGIPTVVNAAVIAHGVIEALFEELKTSPTLYRLYKNINDSAVENIINSVLSPYQENLMVTPKEIDDLIDRMSRIVAGGIAQAVHPAIGPDEFDEYLQ
ncbi:MAG TPA: GPR endopeptidase [Candidatus Deferrimicrobium sp.]|nr:GPR endopeptidase [Candidatus Deferrimicrobium sp.]